MIERIKNIEFVFLAILGLTFLTLFFLLLKLIADTNRFVADHPDFSVGAEWSALGIVLLLFGMVYVLIFLIWQYGLWQSFIHSAKRKYYQLIVIFVLAVFPFLNQLVDLFLKGVMRLEHPFTELITKGYLQVLLFPLTGGK